MAYDYSKRSPNFTSALRGTTHVAELQPAADFKAKATGVGNTLCRSLATGRVRSQLAAEPPEGTAADVAEDLLEDASYQGKGIGY